MLCAQVLKRKKEINTNYLNTSNPKVQPMTTTITQDEQKKCDDFFEEDVLSDIPEPVTIVTQKTEMPTDSNTSNNLNNETILSAAEKRIDLINKITILCLKVTNEHDWEKLGENAYLKASGCKKIARLFGVSSEIISITKEFSSDELGQYYIYTYTMLFKLRTPLGSVESVQEVGTKSSRAQFFAKLAEFINQPLKLMRQTSKKLLLQIALGGASKHCLAWTRLLGICCKQHGQIVEIKLKGLMLLLMLQVEREAVKFLKHKASVFLQSQNKIMLQTIN